ncbi:MAG: hypothetical protein LBN21_10560 [Treponema sp.]|nr:hypothetical protein [Treponema sp.]
MQNKNIDEDTGRIDPDEDDALEDKQRLEAWIKKRTRKIGKLIIMPLPGEDGGHQGLSEIISNWWWNLSNVFWFAFEIGLSGIQIQFWILDMGFKIKWNLPYFEIRIPLVSKLKLHWNAWAHLNKYKGFELETWRNDTLTLGFDIRSNMHTNHYGIFMELDLLFLHVNTSIYDGRHWDDEKHKPEEWPEEANEE